MASYASTENPKCCSEDDKVSKEIWICDSSFSCIKVLPVSFKILYKILILVFKVLHNLAPVYFSGLVAFYIPARSLRSESQQLICTTRTKYKHKGDRAFSQADPDPSWGLTNLYPTLLKREKGQSEAKNSQIFL